MPHATLSPVAVRWDEAHLAAYLRVADDFAKWWTTQRRTTHGADKSVSLVALLARINAVAMAASLPQYCAGLARYRGGLTSKQRWCVERAVHLSQQGRKVVLVATWPRLLELFAVQLRQAGVESVLFHGEISLENRTAALDSRWRYGDTHVLLATYGVAQAGLDLYQAQHMILANRRWSGRDEDQIIHRLLRPQQQGQPLVELPMLAGSLDVYQDQLVSWKADAAQAGLDWGAAEKAGESFVHMNMITEQFVAALAARRGMEAFEYRQQLKEVA